MASLETESLEASVESMRAELRVEKAAHAESMGRAETATAALALAEKASFIPYRDSVLTKLLKVTLSRDSMNAIICCCSPDPEDEETRRQATRRKELRELGVVKVIEDFVNFVVLKIVFLSWDDVYEKIFDF